MNNSSQRYIIGLTGYAGVGKSTVANYLRTQYGFSELSLAGPLKKAARVLGWDGNKDTTGREFLQKLGTEAIRSTFGADFLVDLLIKHIHTIIVNNRLVITDVRFLNEHKRLQEEFGNQYYKLWRVTRNGIGPCNGHQSETELELLKDDWVMTNDFTKEELYKAIDISLKLSLPLQ